MNNLHPIAQAVQSQGRGKDTQLVHMTPNEVAGMQALAKAHGGSLSINPSTGLPEAGFLDSMLPTILGIGITAATGGAAAPWMIGAGIGGLQYMRTGSLEKGLMAGLGAYGGAGIGSSLMGAGASGVAGSTAAQAAIDNTAAQTAAAEAAKNTALTEAQRATIQTAATDASKNLALQQSNTLAANTFGQNLSNMGGGLQSAFSDPTKFMEAYGGSGMDLAKYGGAALSDPLMNAMTPEGGPGYKPDNERFNYTYDPGRASQEDLDAQRAAYAARGITGGELKYFNPTYAGPNKTYAAKGGLLSLAEGGMPSDYEYDPVSQTYKKVAQAPTGAVAPVGVASEGDAFQGPGRTARQEQFLNWEETTPEGKAHRDERMQALQGLASMGPLSALSNAVAGTKFKAPNFGTLFTEPQSFKDYAQTSEGYLASQGLDSDSGFTGADAGGGGFGPSAAGEMAQGGVLRYEDGGPIGAVEPVGLRGNRPMDAGYFKDMAADAARNAVISKLGQAVGLSPQVMALGMAGKGIYNFFNPDQPPAPVVSGSSFPSVPGQNPSGDSGPTGHDAGITGTNSFSAPDGGGYNEAAGGLISLAAGGMSQGGFVVPADVVSALGNGSSDAGLRKLYALIGDVKPIKGKGDGLSDSIPTSIDGRQPARVADGEAYVNPKTVAKIGGGDAKKGAKKLYAMMDKIRQQAHGKKTQQREVNAKAVV